MSKSCTPLDHGFANPHLGKARFLMENADAFRMLAQQVQKIGHGAGALSFGELKSKCEQQGIKEKLRLLFEQAQRVEKTPPVIGVPPTPREIYGRFGKGCEVLDIGSGDGRKIKAFAGTVKFTCVDPNLDLPRHLAKELKCVVEDVLPDLSRDQLISSFMAFCQLKPDVQEQLLEFDGLHMVPDHTELIRSGAAEQRGEMVVVRTPLRIYEDQSLIVPGVPVDTGYRMVATLVKRKIDISFDPGEFSMVDYNPIIDARPAAFSELNLDDVTQKMDGVAFEVENDNGTVYIVDRSGKQFVGKTDFRDHFALHVEKLQNCYTLIRVVAYRSMVPPHCGDYLRVFASRVRIKINGLLVCAPPRWTPDKDNVAYIDDDGNMGYFSEKVDGIISRYNGRDMYCKFQWTADLRDTDRQMLARRFPEMGFTFDSVMLPGLWEYGLERKGHEIVLIPIRERRDKKVPTKFDSIMFMLKRPTLSEQQALESI